MLTLLLINNIQLKTHKMNKVSTALTKHRISVVVVDEEHLAKQSPNLIQITQTKVVTIVTKNLINIRGRIKTKMLSKNILLLENKPHIRNLHTSPSLIKRHKLTLMEASTTKWVFTHFPMARSTTLMVTSLELMAMIKMEVIMTISVFIMLLKKMKELTDLINPKGSTKLISKRQLNPDPISLTAKEIITNSVKTDPLLLTPTTKVHSNKKSPSFHLSHKQDVVEALPLTERKFKMLLMVKLTLLSNKTISSSATPEVMHHLDQSSK